MDDFFKYTYDKDIADKMNEESAREQWISEGKEQGRSEGIEIGYEQGIEQNKKETVKKMLEKTYTLKEIADITGLSIEEIEQIRNS